MVRLNLSNTWVALSMNSQVMLSIIQKAKDLSFSVKLIAFPTKTQKQEWEVMIGMLP